MSWKLALPIVALFALSACNMMQGLGQDVGAAGTAIETEAAQAEQQM